MHLPRLSASTIALALALGLPAQAQELGAPTDEAPAFGVLPQPAEAPDAPEEDVAEEEATPADEAEEETAEPAEEAEEAPATPEEAAGVPQPQVYEVVRDTFDDWEVRCAPDGDDCFLYQLALDADDNPVAEFSLIRLPAGGEAAAGATVVTPLGTLLPAGLLMQIDGGEVRQYPYTFCSQVGCFAQIALTQAQVSALQRGRFVRLGVTSIADADEPVELDVSLIGFTAAYRSLSVPAAAE